MKKTLCSSLLLFSSFFFSDCPTLLDHEVRFIDSQETKNLCDYQDKIILAVNVASKCGYTYQYESLQNLYSLYESNDFVILGFPSRDFLYQEFKEESKVKEFCETKYGVTFPIFATSSVKGKKANSFFKDLSRITGEQPGWNFHKYLIDRKGGVTSFSTKVEPDSKQLIDVLKSLLDK